MDAAGYRCGLILSAPGIDAATALHRKETFPALQQVGAVRAFDDDGFAAVDSVLNCDTNASSSFVKAQNWSSLRKGQP